MTPAPSGSVSTAQLEELLTQLTASIHASGFQPDILIYIESGARAPAVILGERLGIPIQGVSAKRGGDGIKKKLAPLLARMPAWLTRTLRWLEETTRLHRFTKRRVTLPRDLNLEGKRVLLLDDASDTGRTIMEVSNALLRFGLERSRLRVAVIAATTGRARRHVDFWALDRNVRFPWSPDMKQYP